MTYEELRYLSEEIQKTIRDYDIDTDNYEAKITLKNGEIIDFPAIDIFNLFKKVNNADKEDRSFSLVTKNILLLFNDKNSIVAYDISEIISFKLLKKKR